MYLIAWYYWGMKDPYFQTVAVDRHAALGGGQWNLNDLNSLTVIFGKNGSGKSLLLRALRDQNNESIHYVVPERTGTLEFQPGYLETQLSAPKRRNVSQKNYLNEYRQHVVTRVQAYFAARGNVRAGKLPGDPADLERLIGQLIPDFDLALDGLTNPPYKLLRSADQKRVASIDELSSGEAQLLTIGLDVLTMAAIWEIDQREQRLILIDEPDAHIHPDLQVRFADFLVQVAEKYDLQIIVATHSTTFMAALGQFGGDKASVLYLDRTNSNFNAQPFTTVTKELSAVLGGHALMGPLFGVPILLVEGDDDYRIWSQVPRHHVVSFAVLPSNGDEIKRYQRSLEQMFAALREAGSPLSGFALIDADKGKPQPSTQHPQDHILFIQLACHETENLYLTDEVLATLGTDWATASQKIAQEATKFGNKAETLANAPAWDRKTDDIKSVINELNTILDHKNVHWTIRTAQTIGRVRPSGQLADFLGGEVVNYLWGLGPEAVTTPDDDEEGQ